LPFFESGFSNYFQHFLHNVTNALRQAVRSSCSPDMAKQYGSRLLLTLNEAHRIIGAEKDVVLDTRCLMLAGIKNGQTIIELRETRIEK
jgi:hypothetical protein